MVCVLPSVLKTLQQVWKLNRYYQNRNRMVLDIVGERKVLNVLATIASTYSNCVAKSNNRSLSLVDLAPGIYTVRGGLSAFLGKIGPGK